MTNILPYNQYRRAPRRNWPFDAFDELMAAPFQAIERPSGAFAMNVEDTGDAYLLTAELPGVKREQIDVELNEGRLSISVEKTEREEEKTKNYLLKESTSWSATRGVYLKDAATTGLSAKLENGVLSVSVPKQEEKANVTKISID